MPTEQCYGVIVVFKGEEDLFLILQQKELNAVGSWTFPKGHHEGDETPRETALRELKEETGMTEIEILNIPLIYEEYLITRNREKRLKINEYFIGFVKGQEVTIEQSEISNYKWATYQEAYDLFDYSSRKETLVKAQEYLNMVK